MNNFESNAAKGKGKTLDASSAQTLQFPHRIFSRSDANERTKHDAKTNPSAVNLHYWKRTEGILCQFYLKLYLWFAFNLNFKEFQAGTSQPHKFGQNLDHWQTVPESITTTQLVSVPPWNGGPEELFRVAEKATLEKASNVCFWGGFLLFYFANRHNTVQIVLFSFFGAANNCGCNCQ